MSERKWDELIKNKLDEMTSSEKSDWSAMRERYLEEVNKGFDTKIKESLDGYTTPIPDASWDELRAELHRRKEVVRRIKHVKLLEALIVLLICQALFLVNKPKTIWDTKVHQSSSMPMASFQAEAKGTEAYFTDDDHDSIDKNIANQGRIPSQESELRIDAPTALPQIPSGTMDAVDAANVRKSLYKNTQRAIQTEKVVVTSKEKEHGITPEMDYTLSPIVVRNSEANVDSEAISEVDETVVAKLAMLNPNVLQHTKGMTLIPKPQVDKKSQVALYIGRTLLTVQSPYDNVYDIGAYQKVASSFEVGMKYLRKRYRWKYGIGINYHHFAYEPQRIYENLISRSAAVNYDYKIALNKLNYHLISVPMNLDFIVYQGTKSSFSVGLHIAPSFNMLARYDAVVTDTNEELVLNKVVSNKTAALTFNNESSFLAKKDFDEGLLSTANIKKNILLFGGLGMTYNYQLNENIGLTLSGMYSHPFSAGGLGPNKDKISSMSVQVGSSFFF